jgi:FkbM family methyltransferase
MMELLKFRIGKVWQLLPALAARPSRIPWLFQGVTPGRLVSLDVPWIREAGIRTVVDVGANAGQFAATVHRLLPGATIHSFEPLEDCHAAMMERLGDAPGFHAYAVAVGDDDGEVEFQRNEFSQASSILTMRQLHREALPFSGESTLVRVPIRRLDSVLGDVHLEPKVLVKIDVQGFDDRVLVGGEQTIRQAAYVLIETLMEPLYEGQASFERVYELLEGYGFRYGGNLEQVHNPEDGRVLYADALFVRRDG